MSIQKLSIAEAAEARSKWQQAVEVLVSEVQAWAESQGWTVTPVSHVPIDDPLGEYTVPGLEIETRWGRMLLEPLGQDVGGAEGRVDLYAWPTMDGVMLLLSADGRWEAMTGSYPNWQPQPWQQELFVRLAEDLLTRP